jgi:hypothetical protein
MNKLGRLAKVEVREVWRHEAHDFSAWLVKPENLELLSDTIGIQIEPTGTEIGVGRFRIDILAEEPVTGHKIIIENQLEATNHDHLGKVITYAAGLDAKYLIWIVKDVLPEHLKAIEWLNEHLDDEISCFLIKIEVWQIGDSKPAPRFEVIGIKNDWAATVKRTTSTGELSDVRVLQLEFWEYICNYFRERDSQIKLQTPRPRRYLNFSMGNSIASVILILSPQKNRIACELYINNDKLLYSFLQEREDQIKASLGSQVQWFEANIASGLYLELQDTDVRDLDQRKDYAKWCFEQVLSFKKVLTPIIEQYREEIRSS